MLWPVNRLQLCQAIYIYIIIHTYHISGHLVNCRNLFGYHFRLTDQFPTVAADCRFPEIQTVVMEMQRQTTPPEFVVCTVYGSAHIFLKVFEQCHTTVHQQAVSADHILFMNIIVKLHFLLTSFIISSRTSEAIGCTFKLL